MNMNHEPRVVWQGYHTFLLPEIVCEFGGTVVAMVLVSLYSYASARSMKASGKYHLCLPVREKSLARKLHVNRSTIHRALTQLVDAGLIKKEQPRDEGSRFDTVLVTLLDPRHGYPLQAQPGSTNILSGYGPFSFAMPFEFARKLYTTLETAGARAVCLAGIRHASGMHNERVKLESSMFHRMARIDRHSFPAAIRECKRHKLFNFRNDVLQFLDPATGKPSKRPPLPVPRVLDLDTITAKSWQRILSRTLGGEFSPRDDGWVAPTKERTCPFCHDPRCFGVNVNHPTRFNCFKCHESGRLGELVQRVKNFNTMQDTLIYIKEILETSDADLDQQVYAAA